MEGVEPLDQRRNVTVREPVCWASNWAFDRRQVPPIILRPDFHDFPILHHVNRRIGAGSEGSGPGGGTNQGLVSLLNPVARSHGSSLLLMNTDLSFEFRNINDGRLCSAYGPTPSDCVQVWNSPTHHHARASKPQRALHPVPLLTAR